MSADGVVEVVRLATVDRVWNHHDGGAVCGCLWVAAKEAPHPVHSHTVMPPIIFAPVVKVHMMPR